MAGHAHSFVSILGIRFYQGSCEQAVRIAAKGGLTVAPSGPGLAQDRIRDPQYAQALEEAELVLVDSGYLACLYRLFHHKPLQRLSGLIFFQGCLEAWADTLKTPGSSIWVMPCARESDANRQWLAQMDIQLRPQDCYIAPRYARDKVEDAELLERIRAARPRFVFINIGGGIQEKLGAWLRRQLDPCPALICTGAAIAFLSGTQAPIPRWADRFYLGWLLRTLWNPRIFLPRYLGAIRLFGAVRKDAAAARRSLKNGRPERRAG